MGSALDFKTLTGSGRNLALWLTMESGLALGKADRYSEFATLAIKDSLYALHVLHALGRYYVKTMIGTRPSRCSKAPCGPVRPKKSTNKRIGAFPWRWPNRIMKEKTMIKRCGSFSICSTRKGILRKHCSGSPGVISRLKITPRLKPVCAS